MKNLILISIAVLSFGFSSRSEAKPERVSVDQNSSFTGWVNQRIDEQLLQGSLGCNERSHVIVGQFANADEIYRDEAGQPELTLIKNDRISKGTARVVTWVTLTPDKFSVATLVSEHQVLVESFEGPGLSPRKAVSKFVGQGARLTCSTSHP